MDDFPTKLAGFLEHTAAKARALTVDRASNAVRMTTLGIIAGSFGFMAVVFLLLTVYGALEIPLRDFGAFGVLAGLFAIGGMLLWAKRPKE